MPFDHYCWLCHRECASKLICNKCNHNYHLSCVSEFHPILTRGDDNLKKFAQVCPDCTRLSDAAKEWADGRDFEPINKKTLNSLLSYILVLIQEKAPEPFLWPSSRFSDSVSNPLDVHEISKRIKQNFYESPKHFLEDVNVINHNCLIIWRHAKKLRIERSITDKMLDYETKVRKFNSSVNAMIRYLEDCPHCIWNFRRWSGENYPRYPNDWLTMACPWGHPLIISEVDKKYRPAKMIKFNRNSERVDIILFGSAERTRANSTKCWIPSATDLKIDADDSADLIEAKEQALKYIEVLESKFKLKMTFGKERKRLRELEQDYVKRSSPRESADDIIELTDDETLSEPLEAKLNDDTNKKIETELPAKNETNSDDGSSPDDHRLDANEDEIIDEIFIDNQCSNSSSESKKTKQFTTLTTIIEPASPLPEPSNDEPLDIPAAQVPGPSNKEPENLLPLLSEQKACSNASNSGPQVTDPIANKLTDVHPPSSEPASTLTSEPKPEPNSIQVPPTTPPIVFIPKPILKPLSTSETLTTMSPTPSPSNEQFSIVSDDELDIYQEYESANIDEPPIEPLPPAEFVVEEDKDIVEDTLTSECQPFPPHKFTCTHNDDTLFEKIVKVDLFNQIPERSEFHQSKRIKLDPTDSHSADEIKKLKQTLQFAEKEKQLHLQSIKEIQDQLKLTIQMEETKLKTVELALKSQITSLQQELESERKSKDEIRRNLDLSVAEGIRVIRKMEENHSSWQTKLANELKIKDDQHKLEMNSKMEEINELKKKLAEAEEAKISLEKQLNNLTSKYTNLTNHFKVITQEIDSDNASRPQSSDTPPTIER